MKSAVIILSILFSQIVLMAQEDSTFSKKQTARKTEIKDSIKKQSQPAVQIPPRTLIIKMKDIPEIKNLHESPFIIFDDSKTFTKEELESGLSEKELADYKKNKEAIKEMMKAPPSEEETYPTVSKIRKILGVAKTIGVIVIMILSLL